MTVLTAKSLLTRLHQGEQVELGWLTTQGGDRIASDTLSFKQGRWLLASIHCFSSTWLGLGNCHCISHDPVREQAIDRGRALQLLQQLINETHADLDQREHETDWLRRAISAGPADATP